NLEAAVLRRADLALADLHGAVLTDTDFTNSNWWRARGLSVQLLDEFAVTFAPSPDAEESRRRDFTIWLNSRIGGRSVPSQP
ncbi:MAG: pentapeptide repeat-containing protein, partial [Planctomycetaceae bacterium]|nr:pentapeptide repeat-containing protein [Planctomycetaceae bacterium]